MIREDKIVQILSALQTGSGVGMQTLEQSLHHLVTKKMIDASEAAKIKARS